MQPKQFIVSTEDTLRKPSFCWLCGDLMLAGIQFAICRFGNGDGDWEKAHVQCAHDSSLNAGRESVSVSNGLAFGWKELDEYTGRYKYGIFVNGAEVHRTSARARAEGMLELLNRFPNLAASLAVSTAIETDGEWVTKK